MRIFNETEEAELDKIAIITWGIESQLNMVVEECSELILAIQKSRRKSNKGDHSIPEEIADVQNCINQIKKLYPECEQIRQRKLNKMAHILKSDISRDIRDTCNLKLFEDLEF